MISSLASLLSHSRDFLLFRKYQGYYVISALFVAEMAVTGISFYSFSLFIRAWQNDPAFSFTTTKLSFQFSPNPLLLAQETLQYMQALMSGWSLAAINFSFSITLPLVLLTPFMGRLVDTRGVKIVMLLGVPLVAFSFFLKSFMTEVWHLWAIQLIQGLGQSASFLGTGRLVGLWFQKNRGIIMGFTIAGNNAGGMIMAPLTAYLIQLVGWRVMFLMYGVGLFPR